MNLVDGILNSIPVNDHRMATVGFENTQYGRPSLFQLIFK